MKLKSQDIEARRYALRPDRGDEYNWDSRINSDGTGLIELIDTGLVKISDCEKEMEARELRKKQLAIDLIKSVLET